MVDTIVKHNCNKEVWLHSNDHTGDSMSIMLLFCTAKRNMLRVDNPVGTWSAFLYSSPASFHLLMCTTNYSNEISQAFMSFIALSCTALQAMKFVVNYDDFLYKLNCDAVLPNIWLPYLHRFMDSSHTIFTYVTV